jgi:hypothetical protein
MNPVASNYPNYFPPNQVNPSSNPPFSQPYDSSYVNQPYLNGSPQFQPNSNSATPNPYAGYDPSVCLI